MKDLLTETVIKQLRELIEDRKSFIISDAEHDEIYEKDIEALETAIRYAEIVAEMDKPLHDKAEQIMQHYGVCPNCRRLVLQFEQSHGKIEILHCKWCGQALDWSDFNAKQP